MMIVPTSKKGQVQSLAPAMIALVLAAIILVLGLVVVQETRDTDVIARATSNIVINEGVSVNDTVAAVLASVGDRGAGAGDFTVLVVTNASSNATIAAGNYTFSADGTIISVGASDINGSIVNVTYSYYHGDQSWVGANDTIGGMSTFSDFWEIIVLAIVISIVIGLLLVVFAGRRRR